MKLESVIIPVILVPLFVFFLSPYGALGILVAGVASAIASFVAGITGKAEAKEIMFIAGFNTLILIVFYWLFIMLGAKFTIDLGNLMAFIVGNLIGGYLYSLKK